MSRSKKTGTAAESAVVRWLRGNGYPEARRLPLTGSLDCGDVDLGVMFGVILQVKAGRAAERASDLQIASWMGEAEDQALNGGNEMGLLVTKRPGYGLERVGSWHVHYFAPPRVPARSNLLYLGHVITLMQGR